MEGLLAGGTSGNQGREMRLWGSHASFIPGPRQDTGVTVGNHCLFLLHNLHDLLGEGTGQEPGCGPQELPHLWLMLSARCKGRRKI